MSVSESTTPGNGSPADARLEAGALSPAEAVMQLSARTVLYTGAVELGLLIVLALRGLFTSLILALIGTGVLIWQAGEVIATAHRDGPATIEDMAVTR